MQRLIGQKLPDFSLMATNQLPLNLRSIAGMTVVFCYPYTGRPDKADPPGWDHIQGAHGSTPQALAYSKLYPEFIKKNVKVFGLSFQSPHWQLEFTQRNQLVVPLLSDEHRIFSTSLRLPTFKAGDEDYLRRVTLIAKDAIVIAAHDVSGNPANDAADTLRLFERA